MPCSRLTTPETGNCMPVYMSETGSIIFEMDALNLIDSCHIKDDCRTIELSDQEFRITDWPSSHFLASRQLFHIDDWEHFPAYLYDPFNARMGMW